jgi:hypothetical protein
MTKNYCDKNGNDNCLYDIECPVCAHYSEFKIEIRAMVRITDEGTSDMYDSDWTDESFILCTNCNYHGAVREFRIKS